MPADPAPTVPSGPADGPSRYARVKAAFLAAVGAAGPARDAALRTACGGDATLRGEVEALLRRHDEARLLKPGEFAADLGGAVTDALAAAVGAVAPATDDGAAITAPGYRILRRIAVGGMGAVYEAEQAHPRRVALKVLRPGREDEMIRRLAYEAEVLGRLDTRIARLFATGTATSASGRTPFLAMEYVDGVPITAWCRRAPTCRRRWTCSRAPTPRSRTRSSGRGPPRPQAREHPRGRRGPAEGARFRRRAVRVGAGGPAVDAHVGRRAPRHPRLRGPRSASTSAAWTRSDVHALGAIA
jgi:hypothetical protein